MKISEYFKLSSHSQKDYDFVNLRIDKDNELFLDPSRMAVEKKYIGWEKNVQSFYNKVFSLYGSNQKNQARTLFQNSSESNELFLGFTQGVPKGKGNSEDSLTKVFDYIDKKGLFLNNVLGDFKDFSLFVPRFGPDLMTDLIASILKDKLIAFTKEQCIKHNISRKKKVTREYWDSTTNTWSLVTERVPEVNGEPLILVPKEITVQEYLYSTKDYLNKAVYTWRQKYHADNKTSLSLNAKSKSKKPPKKVIDKTERQDKGLSLKEYALDMTKENTELIINYRNNVTNTQLGSSNNKMSDDDFEEQMKE